AEALVKERTALKVVRCRVREDEMVIEVGAGDRDLITEELMAAVREAARIHMTELVGVALDAEPYRPGRAFVQIEAAD
ncbi:MAG: ATPase, partial [bacterium]